jgi:hypothetical protein
VKDLGGHEAVARLERRGGKIEVLPRGRGAAYSRYHPTYTYYCAGREDGATIVVGPDRRWLLRTDTDRAELARDMEATRESATRKAKDPDVAYGLAHWVALDDPGYGEVGCLLMAVSVVLGLVIGIVVSLIAAGRVSDGAALLAPIFGLVISFVGVPVVVRAVTPIPALRDRQGDVAVILFLIVPGIVTALVVIVGSVLWIGGASSLVN